LQTGFFGGIAYFGSDSCFGLIFLYDDRCDFAYGNPQVWTSVPSDEGKNDISLGGRVVRTVRLTTIFSGTGGASLWEGAATSTAGAARWGHRTRPMARAAQLPARYHPPPPP